MSLNVLTSSAYLILRYQLFYSIVILPCTSLWPKIQIYCSFIGMLFPNIYSPDVLLLEFSTNIFLFRQEKTKSHALICIVFLLFTASSQIYTELSNIQQGLLESDWNNLMFLSQATECILFCQSEQEAKQLLVVFTWLVHFIQLANWRYSGNT